jgi:hypothetical protein
MCHLQVRLKYTTYIKYASKIVPNVAHDDVLASDVFMRKKTHIPKLSSYELSLRDGCRSQVFMSGTLVLLSRQRLIRGLTDSVFPSLYYLVMEVESS